MIPESESNAGGAPSPMEHATVEDRVGKVGGLPAITLPLDIGLAVSVLVARFKPAEVRRLSVCLAEVLEVLDRAGRPKGESAVVAELAARSSGTKAPAPKANGRSSKERPVKKDKGSPQSLTDDQKERAQNLFALSRSYEEIARDLGVNVNQVRTFLHYQKAKVDPPGDSNDHPQ